MSNEHYYERLVIRNTAFRETVEAAMMAVALGVYGESPETPGHDNRAALALAIFVNPPDRARLAEFFAWLALYNSTLRGQVFNSANGDITPENMDGAALRSVIADGWNVAANVQEE